jgi:hypothetical protein
MLASSVTLQRVEPQSGERMQILRRSRSIDRIDSPHIDARNLLAPLTNALALLLVAFLEPSRPKFYVHSFSPQVKA